MSRLPVPAEEHYTWKFPGVCNGERGLYTPRADPHMYEDPFDYMWSTEQDALQGLKDFGGQEQAEDENWVLCKVRVEPVLQMTQYGVTYDV